MFYTQSGMNESAYRAYNEQRPARLLFLCDHASNAVPAELNLLGLSEADFARHIAYDIGAAELTRRLADLWDAPALLARSPCTQWMSRAISADSTRLPQTCSSGTGRCRLTP